MTRYVPVSAVIPCYRCGDTIRRTLDSVAAQSMLPREVILVDDGNTDGTAESLRRIVAEYPAGWAKVLSLPVNGGPGHARNAGWDAAAQPYVAFLDADDAWHQRKLEIQYGWMSAHPDAMLTGHPIARMTSGRAMGLAPGKVEDRRVGRRRLLLSNRLSPDSIMLRRELAIRFHPTKRYMEDYWWLLQVAFSGQEIVELSPPLAFTFKAAFGEGGLSARLWEMEKSELDNYWGLARAGKLGLSWVLPLCLWSLVKYARRRVLSALAQK